MNRRDFDTEIELPMKAKWKDSLGNFTTKKTVDKTECDKKKDKKLR